MYSGKCGALERTSLLVLYKSRDTISGKNESVLIWLSVGTEKELKQSREIEKGVDKRMVSVLK